ncbi:MAG: CocE/NonD family hydrolase [Moraxellaceae bacterium]|nr:CocE/NonD family hydrolase [Moraxellaceae bacterium]MDZ4386390.1 CocE/NonD family hydrolase [Moraxellaceae bacterium]
MQKWLALPILSLVVVMTACSNNEDDVRSGGPGTGGPDIVQPVQRVSASKLPTPIVSAEGAASCARNEALEGGRNYRVELTSASGESIIFQVIEPKTINCTAGNPLMLHGHGFGGSRVVDPAGSFLERLQDNGYAVISIDQRGFGESSGTVRVMDPNFEGRDLLQILDWAEENLDYLAHERRGNEAFNLVAGATGSSYGGMYQLLLHNMDREKQRLDVLTPDITPHDLRVALNPGNTVKSAWALLLVVGGEAGATQPLIQGLDPVIKETLLRGAVFNRIHDGALPFFYYHSAKYFLDAKPVSEQDPISFAAGSLSGSNAYEVEAVKPLPIDILFTQGMRDTLFNFNEAWKSFTEYQALGGDVRLFSHESGHILPGTQTVISQLGPLNMVLDPLLGGLNSAGVSLPDLQGPAGSNACGELSRDDVTLAFLNEKLSPPSAETNKPEVTAGLTLLKDKVCLSMGDKDAEWVDFDAIDASGEAIAIPASLIPVPNSVLGVTSLLAPTFIEILPPAAGQTLAGIGKLDVNLAIPGVPLNGCDVAAMIPSVLKDILPVTACDAIIHVGWGARRGMAAPRLLDEQITPLRGLGAHQIDMVGVADRIADDESVGLLVYGYNLQFLTSLSRDLLVPAVSITGTVKPPLLGAN